ncbi:MAG: hypothetical protein C4583_18935 [Anaerolineaceae bacterium]|nr:MAG: hypothetical protein C4583_18935 [Anaerolineaceae bacterium]
MHESKFVRLLGVAVLTAVILGCSVFSGPPTPTPIPTPTQPPTFTFVPPTDTPIPTDTPVPTFTPVPVQSLETIIAAVQLAAQGKGVKEAAPYKPGPGVHPLVVIAPAKEQAEWNTSLPAAWQPSNVAQVELVAVVRYINVEVEKARYIGKGTGIIFVSRIRIDTEIILHEAQTGQTVASTTFRGGEPPTLPKSLPLGTTALYGTSVAYETAQAWLKAYVEP